MNDILKQRLVGALVLIALGIVFWPVLFVETEHADMDRSTQLEPMPQFDDVVVPDPEPLTDVEPVSAADRIARLEPETTATEEHAPTPVPADEPDADAGQSPDPAVEATAPKPAAAAPKPKPKPKSEPAGSPAPSDTPASPALDENGLPIAWVLQVASLSSREKADALTADLIARDYKAYSRAVQRDGDVFYRVFVGPVFEREKLDDAKREIDAELKVTAIIARYVP